MLSLKVALLLALFCISHVNSQIMYQQAQSSPVGQTVSMTSSSSQPSAMMSEGGDLSQIDGLAEVEQPLDQSSGSENKEKPENGEAPIVGQSLLNNFGSRLMPCPINIFNCFPALSSLLAWGRNFPTNSLLGTPLDSAAEASKVVLVLADDEPLNSSKDVENVSSNRVVRQNNMFDDLLNRMQSTSQVYQNLLQQISSGSTSQSPSPGSDLLSQTMDNIQPWANQLLQQGSGGAPGSDFVSQAVQSLNQQGQSLSQLLQQGSDPSNFGQLLPQLSPDRLVQQIMGPLGQASPSSQQADSTSVGSSMDQPAGDPDVEPVAEPEAPSAKADATASNGPSVGQALPLATLTPPFPNFQQFTKGFIKGFASPLNLFQQPQAQASEINEVRVKPDSPYAKTETLPTPTPSSPVTDKLNDMKTMALIQEALQKKNIPILWFRLPNIGGSTNLNATSKSIEDLRIEKKLKDFEKQVVAELQLLQELERIAKQMEVVTRNEKSKPNKDSLYKLSYPLSRTPVHKITRGDIEKALNDEYLKKLFEQTSMNKQKDSTQYLPNTNPFKRQTSSETIPKPMTKDDIIKMMLYAYRMSMEKDGQMLGNSKQDNVSKSQTTFRANIADAKTAAERQRQALQMSSMMKEKTGRNMDMNQQRQWFTTQQQQQQKQQEQQQQQNLQSRQMERMQQMGLNPVERQWMEQEKSERQQQPMGHMERQWMEQQLQRNMQHRQWAEQSMKHIQNFNQQLDPKMQAKQMENPMKMQGERQWLSENNNNWQTEQPRQWMDMQKQNQMEQQMQMKRMKGERQWMEGMMKNNPDEQQRQWIAMGQQQPNQAMQMPGTSQMQQEERQWMEEKNKNLAENQQRQWLETQQQQHNKQLLEAPNAQTSSMSNPNNRNMERDMMDDNSKQANAKDTRDEMQRQWVDKNFENAPKRPSEERQWAEKNMQNANQMETQRNQWADKSKNSEHGNERQWLDKSQQQEPSRQQPVQRQWATGNMEIPNRQPVDQQRQWATEKPQNTESLMGQQNMRQWLNTATLTNDKQVAMEQPRQWAHSPPKPDAAAMQPRPLESNMNLPMSSEGRNRNMESGNMNPQAPVLGEATPQIPEHAEKARHKGIFDDFDIFDLDGGSKKKKDKEKHSEPTIINYYYGSSYPMHYTSPPSYEGHMYASMPSYGTSYGSSHESSGYGSYGSHHSSSHGHQRTAVGDEQIQALLRSAQPFGVTHFRN